MAPARKGNQADRAASSRAARSIDDWTCKVCTGRDGAAYRNFGDRKSCHKCGITKGACFLAKVEKSSGPATNKAARQAFSGQKDSKLQQRETALRRREADLLKREKQLKERCGKAAAEDGEEMQDAEVLPFKFTVEQLAEQKKLLKSQGLAEDDEQVAAISAQIKLQQQAKLADQPGHVRASQAEKEVKRCKTQLELAERRATDLRDKLADLQKQIVEQDNKAQSAKSELQQAESRRDELYRSLQSGPAPAGPAAGPGVFDGALAASALLPQESLDKLGQTREQLGGLLQSLSEAFNGWQEERKKALAAEADKLAASTAAATQAAMAAGNSVAETAGDVPIMSAEEVSELERQTMAAKRAAEAAAERLDQAKRSRARSQQSYPG